MRGNIPLHGSATNRKKVGRPSLNLPRKRKTATPGPRQRNPLHPAVATFQRRYADACSHGIADAAPSSIVTAVGATANGSWSSTTYTRSPSAGRTIQITSGFCAELTIRGVDRAEPLQGLLSIVGWFIEQRKTTPGCWFQKAVLRPLLACWELFPGTVAVPAATCRRTVATGRRRLSIQSARDGAT